MVVRHEFCNLIADMEELEMYISSYFGMSREYGSQLAKMFSNISLKKDHFHTRIGQYNTGLSFIRKGYLRVFSYKEGKEITQWVSSEGEFATDLSCLVFHEPARWNIQALTDCELYSISAMDYERIGSVIPEWEKLERLFLAKCFVTMEDRVHSFL